MLSNSGRNHMSTSPMDLRNDRLPETRTLGRLLSYVVPYKVHVLAAVALALLNTPLMLVSAPLTKAAVDIFIAPDPSRRLAGYEYAILHAAQRIGLAESPNRELIFIAFLFLAAILLAFVMQYAQSLLTQVAGQRVMHDLRSEVFRHLQRLPVRFHDRNSVGRLMTRLTSDIDALNEMFTVAFVATLRNVLAILYILGWMLYINWRITLVFLIPLAVLSPTIAWLRQGMRAANIEMREHIAGINAFLQEHIAGMAVVQLFGREQSEQDDFDAVNERNRSATVRALTYTAVFMPLVELAGAVSVALVVWYGGGRVVAGVATLGTLIAFIQLSRSLMTPIVDLSEKYNIVQPALASLERIFSLLDEDASAEPPARLADATGRGAGKIEFRDVWFAYEGEDWVLKGVSFVVEAGARVAFVGHTGAGKTTLLNLLLGFYEAQRGLVLVDDVDIRKLSREKLRTNFGVVPQEVFVYAGDIAGNIRLGNSNISDDRVYAAARDVRADEFIRRLPAGYQTQVHERGGGLSVGQKQLITFARALAFDPRVLILDEATSSIDLETEALIQAAVRKLMQGRTALVIAHRLSTVQSVDKIVVLHKGEVREAGTHLELLSRRGLYWRLHQTQLSGVAEVSEAETIGIG